ncbi:hypothetical protein PLESTB_000551500 [Pleodorina starrii]|uniref:HTH three-helical bundle domain-containing protein n=1 Tax=Pleodorina starrii TaxID=330485 RepID=A0A9W6BHW9_9CHLO|nr:hypothetical protein PLESTB_000551500 [Pleodorina starrii]GLC69529.1 hypothetical protein PLESTF_000842100 [Pleodorina starrii]
MLSNLQLAGILGLLPQQQGPAGDIQPQNDAPKGQDAVAPQTLSKEEDGADGTACAGPVPPAEAQGPPPGQHQHPHMMHGVPGMPPHPARFAPPPTRWPPSAVAAAHWDYAATACGVLSQQQPPGGGPPGPMQVPPSQPPPGAYPNSQQQGPPGQGPQNQMPSALMSAAPGSASQQPSSAGPSPAATGPPPQAQPTTTSGGPVPGGQLPVQHHPAMPAVRGYPYGPYGEPSPYPPHARPPPGPYHHPGMPGPHGHMVAYHPGFPPMHHLPHRGPYYPHDGRFPPMAPMGHPGYPPPGYFRGHPGMPPPPHPHPAYHYMPPPYGGHHPAMHPGMYHVPQGVPGGPGGQPPQHEAHPRDGTASAASAGTAVCPTGVGSDGGTDPASAARQAGKTVNGSSGGSESEEVGLEAVITLRPGPPEHHHHHHHEDASEERAPPPDGLEVMLVAGGGGGGGNSCTDAAGRPIPSGGMGPGGELLSPDGGPGGMPHPMHHKVAQWPHMAPPPHHAVGGPMPGYEWAPPPPAAMMQGYPPLHASGGWPPYPYDPMAAAAMHHQHMMMGGEEMPEDDNGGAGIGSEMHQVPRRRPSQSSLGGQLSGGGGVPPPPHHLVYGAMRRPPFPQAQHPYAMPMSSGGGKAPFGVDPAAMQRPGSAEAPGPGSMQMQRSGSLGQLFAAVDGQCNVSRRTQRLKKRRSADSAQGQQQPGATPDPFIAAMAAAERAAMGRDSSTGSGAVIGLPPMFPGSAGGARRSSNGSDRTALQCRGMAPGTNNSNRQRSDPGYLIEAGDQGIVGWGLGGGAMGGPMAGLGQLVHYPQQLQQQPQGMQMQGMAMMQQGRRPSENGVGGGGRVINLPKRFEDAIMTLEYPRGPHLGYGPGVCMTYDMPYDDAGPQLEEPVYEEEDEEEGYDVDLGDVVDDSDEDYEAGAAARRVYRGGRAGGAPTSEVVTRKRKAPMMREELPQPEKKRKARDPATISKVVLNCVTILRMVNHDLVYEKEIRNALGNNPDTSKALRLLMNQGKLVRTGQGGRGNPFCYRCTPLGIETLQRIEDAATPDDDPAAGPNPEQRAAAVAVVKPAEPAAEC